ncbi:AfsA-related hotdog domain-containing protein, partial [Streptomyces sp. Act-28]
MKAPTRGAAEKLRSLSWSRTVPRELVHRVSVAEVLLTDVLRVDEVSFAAAACWPRSHPTFPTDGPAAHHPLMVVETLRQLGIFIPIRYFGVPADARSLITDLFFTTDPGARPEVRHGATEITCRARLTGLRTGPDGAATGLRLHVDFLADGAVFAQAGGGARFLPADRYAALRGPLADARPPRSPSGRRRPEPATLGVTLPRDVVVGMEERHRRGAGPARRRGGGVGWRGGAPPP